MSPTFSPAFAAGPSVGHIGDLGPVRYIFALHAQVYLHGTRPVPAFSVSMIAKTMFGSLAVLVQADAAQFHGRQTFRQLLERLAAVGGLVEAAAGGVRDDRAVSVRHRRLVAEEAVELVALAVPRWRR